MSFRSINEAMEWLPVIMRRFKTGLGGAFLVGTHYEEFDEKDPSFKGKLIGGIQGICRDFGCGFVTFSPKIGTLFSRFKVLIKSLVIPEIKKPERNTSNYGPTLFYPNDNLEVSERDSQMFLSYIKSESLKETHNESKRMSDVNIDDDFFADPEIDNIIKDKNKSLDDKLKALVATL